MLVGSIDRHHLLIQTDLYANILSEHTEGIAQALSPLEVVMLLSFSEVTLRTDSSAPYPFVLSNVWQQPQFIAKLQAENTILRRAVQVLQQEKSDLEVLLHQTQHSIEPDAAISWEIALKIADQAVFSKAARHLKNIEVAVLRGTLQGQKYDKIADECGYAPEYIKHDVGPKLWQLLSFSLGEKVNKTNLTAILVRHQNLAA